MTNSFFKMLADAAAPTNQQSLMQTGIMIGVALLFFYFILFRPEQKRKKKMEAMRNAMTKGSRVTAMGIIGTIVKVDEQTVVLKMYDGAKIEMLKAAVTEVHPPVNSEETTAETSAS